MKKLQENTATQLDISLAKSGETGTMLIPSSIDVHTLPNPERTLSSKFEEGKLASDLAVYNVICVHMMAQYDFYTTNIQEYEINGSFFMEVFVERAKLDIAILQKNQFWVANGSSLYWKWVLFSQIALKACFWKAQNTLMRTLLPWLKWRPNSLARIFAELISDCSQRAGQYCI